MLTSSPGRGRGRRSDVGRFQDGRTVLAGASGLLLFLLLSAGPVVSQEVDPILWGTNGNVTGIARSGNTIYIAGAFFLVGPNTGSFVPIDRTSGAALPSFPKVAGVVKAIIPDGHGGWFLGGWFVGVGGVPRSGLAHILACGRVSDWNPGQDGHVEALALKGNTLYVGGSFARIGGEARSCIAALDVVTGHATDWDAAADRPVRVLLVTDSTLYVGGDFANIGGQPRNSLAELNLETGRATGWNPDVGFSGWPGSVRALTIRDDILYVGGMFGMVGPQFRYNLAAVDANTGLATDWNPWVTGLDDRYYGNPYVSTLALGTATVYVGGHFAGIGGQDRGALAELDLVTGVPTSWDPQLGPRSETYVPDVTSLALTDSTIYVGGWFQLIGAQERYRIAEIARETGAVTAWNPRADYAPEALAVSGRVVYAGGRFTMLGWQRRRNLAALDAKTGEPTEWNPDPNGQIVYDVAVAGGKVYVGGHFSWVGGRERWGLAALDPITGQALDWTADTNESVRTLEVAGDRLLAGGYFTTINGVPRSYLASFDLATGELTDWNPGPDDDVYEIAVTGDVVYLGGGFWSVGGQPRKYLAAVDAATGEVRDWDPKPELWVYAVAVKDSTVFVGGAFRSIGGQPRSRLAALDATTGAVKDWAADATLSNPNLVRVYDLRVMGQTLYVGGSFDAIGGQPRGGLAALDAETGAVLDWDPALGGPTSDYPLAPGVVWSLASSGTTLYAGGRFRWAGSVPVASLAAISTTPDGNGGPAPVPTVLAVASVAPNPARSSATIRYSLPAAGPVNLAVFDVQGRRIASLLSKEPRQAGIHEVPVRTAGWPEGFYFCRLEAGGATATRKMVVLK
ncbi:MAG: T9SS type A sorting domain-containing protein [Candidatus Eisenbacteria bacterium]|nr:T9SS type A sorting domain-containing protein [Candidatus Eisenbacteria bacterium]